jgi:thioredoxin 1
MKTNRREEETMPGKEKSGPVGLTAENFHREVLESSEPVLVDFWADWCGPCRMIAPVIEELAADFEGRAKVVKVDVDRNGPLAARYGIRSIPTLLLFKDGQVVEHVVGVVPKEVLADKLNGLLRNGT